MFKWVVRQDRDQRNLSVVTAGVLVNAFLAAGKFVAGVMGYSQALIADAVESFADIGSSIIVWRGLKLASLPADAKHPYGHGKAEAISSAIVAGMLMFAALGIGFQSFRSVFEDRPPPKPFTLFVLLGVVILKESWFRYTLKVSSQTGSSAVHADAWHHRSDAITSLAAGLGILVALIGGPAFAKADSIAALLAAGFIFYNGIRLLNPSMNELMDAAPRAEVIGSIRRAAESVEEVFRVEKCIVRKTGYYYLVDMHIEVAPEMTVREAHRIAHVVQDRVREEVPKVHQVLVHIEPAQG